MATGQLNGVLCTLRRVALLGDTQAHSDADLLHCFIARREEWAFAGLVRRLGPMVFCVCRRILGNTHDTEDAFQATFLVLARKAASIRPRAMVGNWLYGVAYRTASRAKTMIAKRQAREKNVSTMPNCEAPPEIAWSDLGPLIDQELNALDDKYRAAIVLCDLEGKSQRAAAKQLGWPEGTLMTRLARARKTLAKRLSRRGVALSVGALTTLLAQNGACAAAPGPLMAATVQAAALGSASQALISAKVAALTEGVLHTMFLAKLKSVVVVLFAVLVLGSGAGVSTLGGQADRAPAASLTPAANQPADGDCAGLIEQERGGREAPANAATLRGRIVAVAEDGKSITVEVPSVNRGEGPVKREIKLTDKTELKFFGVGPGGAKLAEGLLVQIWTTEAAASGA